MKPVRNVKFVHFIAAVDFFIGKMSNQLTGRLFEYHKRNNYLKNA